MRVPLLNASLTDCVFSVNRDTTAEEVNQLLQDASKTGPLVVRPSARPRHIPPGVSIMMILYTRSRSISRAQRTDGPPGEHPAGP